MTVLRVIYENKVSLYDLESDEYKASEHALQPLTKKFRK